MKLKNKLLISYGIVISGVLLLAFFITTGAMRKLNSLNTVVAKDSIEKITQENNKLSSSILTAFGERFVGLRCETAALKLQKLLLSQSPPYNYTKLRTDDSIRKIATQIIYVPIKIKKINAGNMDLLDIHGVAVIHHDREIEGRNYERWKDKYPQMWKIVKESSTKNKASGYYTFIDKNNKPVKKYMALQRIEGTPFILCAAVEIRNYFQPMQKLAAAFADKKKVEIERTMETDSDKILHDEIIITGIAWFMFIMILGFLLALWQAGSIAKPIHMLCSSVKKLGTGDFSILVQEKGSSEIAELATAFNNLGSELTEYTENLKKEITARESIESEIAITRSIQESLLPHTFPPFPDRDEFKLHASLIAAKNVSGDFYDFYFIDDDTLVLTIADVSGKGLPASLFMAVTRTLLRNLCMNMEKNYQPSEIFKKANNYLCNENETCMFVTAFMAFYNIKTGNLVYANAGHNSTISLKKNKKCSHFGVFPDLPLGIQPDYNYRQGEYTMETEETLVFFTDGVTEATDPENRQYGTERFEQRLTEYSTDTPLKLITEDINNDLSEFQKNNQFDDITIMMIRKQN